MVVVMDINLIHSGKITTSGEIEEVIVIKATIAEVEDLTIIMAAITADTHKIDSTGCLIEEITEVTETSNHQ